MTAKLTWSKEELKTIMARNPHLRAVGIEKPAREATGLQIQPPGPRWSKLEAKFARVWDEIGGPAYEREVLFCETRKYRLDFCWKAAMCAVEIQGLGALTGKKGQFGGHQTIAGVKRDCEKLSLAVLCGWTVFPLTSDLLKPGWLSNIKNYIERRLCGTL